MKRNGVLDIFHPCQQLNHSLEAESEASRVGGPLSPEVQVPLQTIAETAQSLLEDVRTRFPQTPTTELPHPLDQEVDTADEAGVTRDLPHIERFDVLRPVDDGHRASSSVLTQPLLMFPAQIPALQGSQRGLGGQQVDGIRVGHGDHLTLYQLHNILYIAHTLSGLRVQFYISSTGFQDFACCKFDQRFH